MQDSNSIELDSFSNQIEIMQTTKFKEFRDVRSLQYVWLSVILLNHEDKKVRVCILTCFVVILSCVSGSSNRLLCLPVWLASDLLLTN
jgi:hypothetical protein